MTEAWRVGAMERLTGIDKGPACAGRHVRTRRVDLVLVRRGLLICIDDRLWAGRAFMHRGPSRRHLREGSQHHEAGQDDDGEQAHGDLSSSASKMGSRDTMVTTVPRTLRFPGVYTYPADCGLPTITLFQDYVIHHSSRLPYCGASQFDR